MTRAAEETLMRKMRSGQPITADLNNPQEKE